LTLAQFAVLCALYDHGPLSLTEVVSLTAVDQATARGVISRLKSRGLLSVKPDPVDKRKTISSLTTSGQKLVQETAPHAALVSEETFGVLNPAERIAFTFLLRKMLSGRDEAF